MENKPWLAAYDADVPKTLPPDDGLIQSILEKAVEKYSQRDAVNFFGYTMTYARLWKAVQQFAKALADVGVAPSDRVLLLLPNTPHFIIAYYGALKAGAIVVPTNPLYSDKELTFQIQNSGAETLVTLDMLYAQVQKVRPQTGLQRVIVGRIQDYLPPLKKLMYPVLAQKGSDTITIEEKDGVYLFARLMKRKCAEPPSAPISADDVAMLQYTGGTTGVAKGAMLTHRNIVSNNQQMRGWYQDIQEGRETFISVLPYFHSYGMAAAMSLPVSIGATMVLFPKFAAKDILKAIKQNGASVLPGIPSIYSVLSSYKDVKKYDISSINYCLSGAAPLPITVLENFERITGGIIVEGYGLTEASPVTHCNPLRGKRKVGSIGLPLPDTDCKIVNLQTGEEVPTGEAGEFCIKGPQVMKGYWNNEEETRETLRDGWLYTGDIARMDEDGYFYIAERKKDMIISEGFNIYPREIEEFLLEHPAVADAAVVGTPDKLRGERVLAHVVVKKGMTATPDELMRYCKENLVKYKVPKKFIFTEAIPTTLVGKKLRRVLRDKETSTTDTDTP